ncbi:MAG: hypothetical protein WD066_03015 [Planctomycetaceae bacterium]
MPVAIDAMFARVQEDSEGEFLRDHDAIVRTSSGAVRIITANGKRLARGLGIESVKSALEEWDALPEEERRPGAVIVPEKGKPDPRLADLRPPEGCLILRVANRHLARDDQDELRYLLVDDFSTSRSQRSAERYAESSNDFLWIFEEEWKALLPEKPRVGDRAPVPEALQLRLFRYHMNPMLGVIGGICFRYSATDDGELTAVVEEAGNRVRLRLEGSAKLSHTKRDTITYEPALFGYVEYDADTRTIDRFDLIAFGNLDGPMLMEGFLESTRPFGVAFELIKDPNPAETLRPHGCGKHSSDYHRPAPR